MLALNEWQLLLSLTTGLETRKGRLMKLLYTDMSQDLTEILTEQATSYAQKGKTTISAPMIAAIPYDSAIACILGT